MGVLRVRAPWTRQPQTPTASLPQYRFSYLCNHAIDVDLVRNAIDGKAYSWTHFNGDKHGPGARGLGPQPTGVTIATVTKSLGSEFVLVAVISDWTTGATAQSILDDDDGASRVYQFRVYNTKVEFIRFNTAGSAFTCSSATLTSGQRTAGIGIVARSNGAAVDLWVDGVKTSTTLTGTPKAANSTFGVLGRKGTTQPFLGRCYMTGAVAGYWSDAECASVSINPWQVFTP